MDVGALMRRSAGRREVVALRFRVRVERIHLCPLLSMQIQIRKTLFLKEANFKKTLPGTLDTFHLRKISIHLHLETPPLISDEINNLNNAQLDKLVHEEEWVAEEQ